MYITILVVTYQQEKYITATLESIKYQVENFGGSYEIELIITDDCSKDNTQEKISSWCVQHEKLFKNINLIFNTHNLGVAQNLTNAISQINGQYVKLLGGDDLLPCNNIFSFFDLLIDYDMVSGLTAYFWNYNFTSKTYQYIRDNIALEIINKNTTFYHRIQRSCFVNAPGLYLKTELIKNDMVLQYLPEFKLMDDYPMWVKAAEYKPQIKYLFVTEVGCLYRRTNTSISVSRNKQYLDDRIKLSQYLFFTSRNIFHKLIHLNEIICFSLNNKFLNKYGLFYDYIVKLFSLIMKNKAILEFKKIQSALNENEEYLHQISSTYH